MFATPPAITVTLQPFRLSRSRTKAWLSGDVWPDREGKLSVGPPFQPSNSQQHVQFRPDRQLEGKRHQSGDRWSLLGPYKTGRSDESSAIWITILPICCPVCIYPTAFAIPSALKAVRLNRSQFSFLIVRNALVSDFIWRLGFLDAEMQEINADEGSISGEHAQIQLAMTEKISLSKFNHFPKSRDAFAGSM